MENKKLLVEFKSTNNGTCFLKYPLENISMILHSSEDLSVDFPLVIFQKENEIFYKEISEDSLDQNPISSEFLMEVLDNADVINEDLFIARCVGDLSNRFPEICKIFENIYKLKPLLLKYKIKDNSMGRDLGVAIENFEASYDYGFYETLMEGLFYNCEDLEYFQREKD